MNALKRFYITTASFTGAGVAAANLYNLHPRKWYVKHDSWLNRSCQFVPFKELSKIGWAAHYTVGTLTCVFKGVLYGVVWPVSLVDLSMRFYMYRDQRNTAYMIHPFVPNGYRFSYEYNHEHVCKKLKFKLLRKESSSK